MAKEVNHGTFMALLIDAKNDVEVQRAFPELIRVYKGKVSVDAVQRIPTGGEDMIHLPPGRTKKIQAQEWVKYYVWCLGCLSNLSKSNTYYDGLNAVLQSLLNKWSQVK